MPQYFSGADPSLAFSEGLMRGYEFVDRIKSRRRELELQDRRQKLAENADQRAEEGHELNMEVGTYNLARGKTEDAREDETYDFNKSERDRLLQKREENEGARGVLGGAILSNAQPSSLGSIANADTARAPRGPQAAPLPQAAATAPATPRASQPARSAAPVDLRAAQKQIDDEPGFFEKAKSLVVDGFNQTKQKEQAQDAKTFWSFVADPKMPKGYHRDIGKGVNLADIRRDPASYAFSYLKDRQDVPADARGTLDLTMTNALKERSQLIANEIKGLDSRDQRNAPKIKALTDRLIESNRNLDSLAKSQTATAARDAGITRPVKVDDERVVPAITAAASKARESQPIIQTSPDELRAARTMVARAQTGKRLNEKQISALTTLYTNGEINAEELTNWSKYGTPIAPKQPSIQALGGGYAAIISDAGISLMQLPGGGKDKKESAASRSNIRLLNNDRLGELNTRMKDLVESGDLSDGTPGSHAAKFLDFVKREGAAIQTKAGIPLFDGEGALDLSAVDPAEWSQLIDSYAQYDSEEVKGVPFIPTALTRDNKSCSEYVPGVTGSQDDVIDLTQAFQ